MYEVRFCCAEYFLLGSCSERRRVLFFNKANDYVKKAKCAMQIKLPPPELYIFIHFKTRWRKVLASSAGRATGSLRDWWWGWKHLNDCSHSRSPSGSCSHSFSSACSGGSWRAGGHASSGGHCAWSASRRGGSQISSPPCGCGNAEPAHRSGQTSCCTLPNGIQKGAHLLREREREKDGFVGQGFL